MRYHGVYPKIAVVIYLNEKKWCQSLGDWGYPVFKTLRSSALRCCQLQQLKSIRPVSGHDACGALALLSLFTEVSFLKQRWLGTFWIYAFYFFPWILWLSEKLHIARGWKLEWWLIAASRRCALKAGMGNEWITLFWWKKTQCLALKHLLISITPKIARRFSLLLTMVSFSNWFMKKEGGSFLGIDTWWQLFCVSKAPNGG